MHYFEKKGMKNICLIGLMGSGKTVIGRDLSRILKSNFVDTDQEIEKYVGKNINSIFTEHGEKYFRKIEEDICLKVLKYSNCVISLGGGSIINKEVRNMIENNSYSVYLKVETEVLLKRLKNSKKRPLLNDKNKKSVIESIFEKRKNFYNKANLIIENNFEKKDIINKIVSNINQL